MEIMKTDIVVRHLKLEDASELKRIHDAIASVPIDFEKMVAKHLELDGKTSLVAELKGRVVGYIISYSIYGICGLEKGAWIVDLGVDPKYMGEGIGICMAEELFDIYQKMGIENIFSSVRWDSIDLLSFFKKLGFNRSAFINLQKHLGS